jgi:hypothetical protein
MSPADLTLAGIIAAAVVLALVIVVALPVVLSMRQAARDREYTHSERLKSLELGRPLLDAPATDGSTRRGDNGIGVWVPLGALGIALIATEVADSPSAAVAIWVAAGAVGVTGVICGCILALRAPSSGFPAPRAFVLAKPTTEEDGVDTVSRRGEEFEHTRDFAR